MEEQTFAAVAYHSSLNKGRSSVTARVSGSILCFEHESLTYHLPFEKLMLEAGGASNRLIFFSHSSLPDWRFSVNNKGILNCLTEEADADLSAQITKVKKGAMGRSIYTWSVVACLPLLLLALWAAKGPLTSLAVEAVPIVAEKKLGEIVFSQMTGAERVLDTPEISKDIETLIAPLLEAIKPTPYTFKVIIIDKAQPNAYALPGGFVTIHSGLIMEAENPDEVLGVVAHEIAHVTKRHGLKNIAGAMGLVMVVQTLMGDISSLLAIVAEKGVFLLQQKNSREAEEEADKLAVTYLRKANINPKGLITFLKKLKAHSDATELGKYAEYMSWLQTHPATTQRIDYLTAKLTAADADSPKSTFDFQGLKDRLSAQHLDTGDKEEHED